MDRVALLPPETQAYLDQFNQWGVPRIVDELQLIGAGKRSGSTNYLQAATPTTLFPGTVVLQEPATDSYYGLRYVGLPVTGPIWAMFGDLRRYPAIPQGDRGNVFTYVGDLGPHSGLDIGADGEVVRRIIQGENPSHLLPWVYAPSSGVVETVVENYGTTGYGNYVSIRHADNSLTIYGHLLHPSRLHPNDPIRIGTPIGQMGKTGNVSPLETAYHLHWEYRDAGGATQNPLSYLVGGAWLQD